MNINTFDTPKGNIQIVDDKPENLHLLSSILKNQGYETRMAINGELALKSIRSHPPDLILLDIMMPGLSGYEVCKQLKADAFTCDIPIIFISALFETTDKLKAFSIGGVDYITKPFQEDEVLARVQTHLSLRKMQTHLNAQNILLQQEIIERKQAEEERLHLQQRLQKVQKIESLGRMAGAVAHHFNNLIFIISGNLELIREKLLPQSEESKFLDAAEGATRRATELGRLMLTYVGSNMDESLPHDFTDAVALAVPLIEDAIPDNIRLYSELTAHLPVAKINPHDVCLIVKNLVENAWEALDNHAGTVRIATGKTSCGQAYLDRAAWSENCKPGEHVYLEVADDGCGMKAEMIERIFDPFFTTKFTGRGMGLASVVGIVRAKRGAVTVSSELGAGSVVRVLFPAVGAPMIPAKPAPKAVDSEIPVRGSVLLAEDDEAVRKFCQNMLKRIGFKVLTVADGAEAVDVFREKNKDIACVLCDLSMPRMDGWETLRAIREIRPDTPVILASGYDEVTAMRGDHTVLPQVFLHKPYHKEDLKEALRIALGN